MISPSLVLTSSEGMTWIGRSDMRERASALANPLWSVTQRAPRPREAATSTNFRGSFNESLLNRVWQCMSTFILSAVICCPLNQHTMLYASVYYYTTWQAMDQ